MNNDLPLFFSENNYQSENLFLSTIGVAREHESFLYLLENGYLKKNIEGKLAFDFVGLIVLKEKLLCIFPKYYNQVELNAVSNSENYFTDFIQILKVLKKKAQTSVEQGQYNFIATDKQANELVIAEEIIKDYIANGIYLKDRTEYSLNSEGEINWDATVSILQPIFSKRNAIYSDVYSSNTLIEEDYIITQIHKWAVKFCIKKYARLLDYKIIFEEDTANDYLEIGDTGFLISILSKELNVVFVDRNIRLLKLLRSLIAKNYDQKNKGITLYGTNTFHVIWEETCSVSFNNKKDDVKFKNIIPKPQWVDLSGTIAAEKHTIVPDIICEIEAEKYLFIIDAKYYTINFEIDRNTTPRKLKVSDNPGVSDVTKQILYEQSFIDAFGNDYQYFNILIFPRLVEDDFNNDFWKIFGSVKFNLNVFQTNIVWLMYLNPSKIFEYYLNNECNGESTLSDISLSIRTISPSIKLE